MIGTMLESRSLDESLHFDSESLFEYIEELLHAKNSDIIGDDAEKITNEIYEYIRQLQLPDSNSVILDLEDLLNEAICENAHYAYKAGFKEGVRLLRTLMKL